MTGLISELTTTNQNNPADHHLVDKVLHGDTNAFATIIKNTERLVAQVVFKLVDNAEDRKDIAQDIYVKAFHNLRSFRFQSKLSTWIAQIAYNTCINYLDKKKPVSFSPIFTETESSDDEQEPICSHTLVATNNDIEKFLSRKQLADIVWSEVELLPPLYKTLVTLYHNEELSYAEIAEITQLPEGTLKSYLFRARKTLRDNLLLKYKKEEL